MKNVTLCVAAVLAAGCASTPTPHYDAQMGAAVRDARLAMTIDPAAGSRADNATGIDGRAATEAVKRYQNTFKEPPPTIFVFTGGAAVGGGR